MLSYPIVIANWMTRVIQSGMDGEAIVLVHGTGGRADRWVRNMDGLAAPGRAVYALDLPGHGFAGKGRGFTYSVPAYANFLRSFLDTMKIDKAVIVGTSLGGHVAALFALESPERVQSLVLCGSMGLIPLGPDVCGRVARGAVNQSRDGIKEKLTRLFIDSSLVTADLVAEEFLINNSEGAQESFEFLGEYIGSKLDAEVVGKALAQLPTPVPTLLVWGREDRTVPLSAGEKARAILPSSRLVVMSDSGHAPYFERPDDFNRVVDDFLCQKLDSFQADGIEYR
jgi:2-hydroxy-6-oxonona-2,4-dienedioate hydrolase